MDYNRIYWLCLLGFGLLFLAQRTPELLAGSLGIAGIGGLVGSVVVATIALYELGRPTATDGPTEPNLPFLAVVLGFVLLFAGTVLEFI